MKYQPRSLGDGCGGEGSSGGDFNDELSAYLRLNAKTLMKQNEKEILSCV